jgi:hypothetical protein
MVLKSALAEQSAGKVQERSASQGDLMAQIVVTRLRLRDPAVFEEFFVAAIRAFEQAKSSDGNLGADVMADANNTYWTRTAWQDDEQMRAFMMREPHLSTMARIGEWCDEATFVKWAETGTALPDWGAGYERLVADGQVVDLPAASPENAGRAFPRPETPA